ncbi:homoserine kinase [Sulfuriroseicoccus oceanibius]|uniref:Homoserine kinase n=1 Tax=Sulfuriroseicoccus oceanibius TaxID=2707525 RepID=A0A6B3LBH4_9BACT|nr:homoserine kinase [Sulfuriroseicoccus oceanibius]QQL46004.1 homoserine kinase [Sulfuriroseicoccus oceanibius]
MPLQKAVVQVPASTSNLGPGYDCLGLALQIYNRVTVNREKGEGAEMVHPAHPMVEEATDAYFKRARGGAFAYSWSIEGDVPMSRGLGSSVTLRLGILTGLNALNGSPLDQQALFEICAELEGHPDNAGPATFGGFVVADEKFDYYRFDVEPELQFVLLIPDYEVLTDEARKLMPKVITHKDAVTNTGNACKITAAIATKQYHQLRGNFDDYLHQPYREHLVPGLREIIDSGKAVGAVGGFLSGSGSTVACLTVRGDGEKIGQAMRLAHPSVRDAEVRVVSADNDGARVLYTE